MHALAARREDGARVGSASLLLGCSKPLRPLLVATLALALAGTAVAAGGPPGDPGGGVGPAEQVKDGEAPGFSARGRESLNQNASAEEEKAKERERYLDSDAARAERERSKTAYSHSSDSEASELLSRRFADELEPITSEPEELLGSGRLHRLPR